MLKFYLLIFTYTNMKQIFLLQIWDFIGVSAQISPFFNFTSTGADLTTEGAQKRKARNYNKVLEILDIIQFVAVFSISCPTRDAPPKRARLSLDSSDGQLRFTLRLIGGLGSSGNSTGGDGNSRLGRWVESYTGMSTDNIKSWFLLYFLAYLSALVS